MNPVGGQHHPLIAALMNPDLYDHPVEKCQLIETHISWVILTGTYAYKIKKPVNLGFLDFSSLEKRGFYCEEELRLNRRLAPDIYLAVVPITGTHEQPFWAGEGEPIEFAVQMVQFPQEAQLDRMLARGELEPQHIDAIARMVADFHQRIALAGADSAYGDPEHVRKPVEDNFKQICECITEAEYLDPLTELEHWSKSTFDELQSVFVQRKTGGFIRECHGDMHLRNLAWVNEAPVAFDCIEFNPNLRWIDVISEVAFLLMDLQDREQPQLAQRFLNKYLEYSGDYAGTRVLPFYLVYRALVRAKVDAIRVKQTGISQQEQIEAMMDFSGYLQLAQSYTRTVTPQLIITRGLSASGKSTLTQPLLEHLGAVRIRSDVERKRLLGMKPEEGGQAGHNQGIYSAEFTQRTYDKLAELAGQVIDAGYPVVVDAACLKPEQRAQFQQLAAAKKVPYIILEFIASPGTLRQRIVERKDDVSDANLKILEHQLADWHPLCESERPYTITIDTEAPFEVVELAGKIKSNQEQDRISS